MREILFRGKRLDNGEWVAGNLVIATDRINSGKAYILPSVSDFSYGDNGNRIRIGCFVEVDPSTVGQYTGLCDKNGKKIFEGDVLRDAYGMQPTCSVIFNCFCSAFQLQYVDGFSDFFLCSIDHSHMEVIGNVHDNPELLEGEG